jgi:hypothetical protein
MVPMIINQVTMKTRANLALVAGALILTLLRMTGGTYIFGYQ